MIWKEDEARFKLSNMATLIKASKLFKNSKKKPELGYDETDFGKASTPGLLFGQPLAKVSDFEGLPHESIMNLLSILWKQGPTTFGIFRKSGNIRLVRDLKKHLDNGTCVDFEQINIYAIATLLKDYLRSLPDCLLTSYLFEHWLQISKLEDDSRKIQIVRQLFSRLDIANVTLIKFILCILNNIAENCDENKMTCDNLAICIGPSILFPINSNNNLDYNLDVIATMRYLIENYDAIFEQSEIEYCISLLNPESNTNPQFKIHFSECETYPSDNFRNFGPNKINKTSLATASDFQYSTGDNLYSGVSANFYEGNIKTSLSSYSLCSNEESSHSECKYFKLHKMYNYSRRSYYTRYQVSSSRGKKKRSSQLNNLLTSDTKGLFKFSSEENFLSDNFGNNHGMTDLLDKARIVRKGEQSYLANENKLSSKNVSKDSGIMIDDCPIDILDVEASGIEAIQYSFENLCCDNSGSKLFQKNTQYLKKVNASRPSKIQGNSVNNDVIFTDEPLCIGSPINSDSHEDIQLVISKSNFQRKSWTRKNSKKR